MGSFVQIPLGQSAGKTQSDLQTIKLTAAHPGYPMIERLRACVPFTHIMITGLDATGHGVGTGTYLLSDFPAEYMAEYYAGDFIDSDPLVAVFREGANMCADSDAFAHPVARRLGQRVRLMLDRHGITERTIVRVLRGDRTSGTVVVNSPAPLTETQRESLRLAAYALHNDIATPILANLNVTLRLTRGELYCLERAARGLTSEDIAGDREGERTYSVETVNTYLKSATRKLGAHNRTHAVAEAIRRQLIV